MNNKSTGRFAWQKNIIRFFLPFLKPDQYKLYILAAIRLMMTGVTAIFIWHIGLAVSQITSGQFDQLYKTLLVIAGIVLFNQLVGFVSAYIFQRMTLGFIDRLRGHMLEHVMRVSFQMTQKFEKADLMTRLNNDADRILTYVVNLPLNLFSSIVVLIIYSSVLLWIDWQLSLIALTMAPFFFLSQHFVAPKTGEVARKFTQERADLVTTEEHTLSNLRGISAFNSEQLMRDKHKKQFDTARKWALKARQISIIYNSLFTILMYFAGVVVVYSGIASIESGKLDIGALISFLIYVRTITGPVRTLARMPIRLHTDRIAAERIMEVLALQPTVTEANDAEPLHVNQGNISFDAVTFVYPNQTKPIFSALNVDIQAGESVALVGPSGAGKSTFAGLLLRFYDPQQGVIRIDNVNIKTVTLRSLRDQISIVWQEPFLTSGTIRHNLLLAKPGATEEQMISACRSSFAWEFIEGMVNQMDTVIGTHGVGLSVGQRQRLAIAQAFLRDTQILILDEASSALDSQSEQMVVEALQSLRKQRTTLVIAHRYSSIRNADRILYFNGNGTVTTGTHEELLETHSDYKSAVEWQTT